MNKVILWGGICHEESEKDNVLRVTSDVDTSNWVVVEGLNKEVTNVQLFHW